jgi:hypothetical protein
MTVVGAWVGITVGVVLGGRVVVIWFGADEGTDEDEDTIQGPKTEFCGRVEKEMLVGQG